MASGHGPQPPGHVKVPRDRIIILNKYSPCNKQDSGVGSQAADVNILILRKWALGNQLATFNYLTIFITLQLARQLLTVNQMPDDCRSAEGKKTTVQ